MNLPDWLRKENINASSDSIDPEVRKAIDRYEEHFGKFDIDMVFFFTFSEIIEIIDYCIKMDICYQELYPRDPNAIY